jgi:hypothetical protein
MNSRHQGFKQNLGLVSAICGSLIVSLPAIAQTTPNATPISPADRERICTEYMNMNRNQTGTTGSTAGTTNKPGTTGRTGGTTNQAGTTGRTGGTTNQAGTTGRTGTDTTGTTAGSDRTAMENMSAEELDRLCANMNQPGINQNVPGTLRQTNPQTNPSNPTTAPSRQRRSSRIVPPTPEQQQAASARIRPVNGRIALRLVNETGANITYQIIGDSNERSLPGRSYVTLQTLLTPTTITFYRPDYGLLMARPRTTAQPGMLEVRFAPTTDLGMDKNALTIEPTGAVFLN